MKTETARLTFCRRSLKLAAVFLLLATVSRVLRIFYPNIHPSPIVGIYLEHLACGMFATVFAATAVLCRWHRLLGSQRSILFSALVPALCLSAFNLSWELLQFMGLAWYASQPGLVQWNQVLTDQLGIVVAVGFVTLPLTVFHRQGDDDGHNALRSAQTKGRNRS